jgi:hypothetical protein
VVISVEGRGRFMSDHAHSHPPLVPTGQGTDSCRQKVLLPSQRRETQVFIFVWPFLHL